MSPGELALAEYVRQLGVSESPLGSNRTPFGVWYGTNGVPWCAILASYCFHTAGVELCAGYAYTGCKPGKGCAWVPSILHWLRERGWFIEKTETPRPGDLVMYDWDGGIADHIGIVESAPGPKRIVAIEGNVGSSVRRMRRPTDHVCGYGRVGG